MSSIRIVKKSDSWELPGEGTHQAVLVAVTDKGLTKTKFGDRDFAELHFNLDQTGSDGLPLSVKARVTKSLYFKAKLAEYIEALTGVAAADIPQGETVELQELVGKNCLLVIKHNLTLKDGKRWANVISALCLPPGIPMLPLPGQQPAAQSGNHQRSNPQPAAAANTQPSLAEIREQLRLAELREQMSQSALTNTSAPSNFIVGAK